MMRWEYLLEDFTASKPPHPPKGERLNELGSQGWELIWTDGVREFIFRRPLPCECADCFDGYLSLRHGD
jgi:hypothetical protein